MPSKYAADYSPCCQDTGHAPKTDKGNTFFCMSCGSTYESKESK